MMKSSLQKAQWVDTHAHLLHLSYQYTASDFDRYLQDLHAQKISVIDICTDMQELPKIIALQEQLYKQGFTYLGLYTAGIHPMHAGCSHIQTQLDAFDLFLAQDVYFKHQTRCIAIGEIGLDARYIKQNQSTLSQQLALFENQLALIQKHQRQHLPIILHMPRYIELAISLLHKYNIDQAIFHAYSSSLEEAQKIIDAGYFLGLGALIFNQNGQKMQKVLQNTPIENWLLETDAPYMQNFSQKALPKNMHNSLNIPLYADYLSQIRNISTSDLQIQLSKNTQKIWGF